MLATSSPAEEALAPAPANIMISMVVFVVTDDDIDDCDDNDGKEFGHLWPSELCESDRILVWFATSPKQKVENTHL